MSDLTVSRRQVLASAVAAGAVVAAGSPAAAHGRHDTAEPFPLGVASGDPTAFSVILWTRLARDLYAPGGLSRRSVEVSWEVAADERFRRVVRRGRTLARPELAHSVHV